jgi:hypothetical protein
MRNKTCRNRNRPLVRIDYYGEVLIGCIDCNRWGNPGDKTLAGRRSRSPKSERKAKASAALLGCENEEAPSGVTGLLRVLGSDWGDNRGQRNLPVADQ